jgi:hypothetical protein
MAGGTLLPHVVFSGSLTLGVFVILNREYPRLGLIRLAGSDQPLLVVLERLR